MVRIVQQIRYLGSFEGINSQRILELHKTSIYTSPAVLQSRHQLYRLDLEVERYQRENETLVINVSKRQSYVG